MNKLIDTPYLDLSNEVSTSRLGEIVSDGRGWTVDSIGPNDAVFKPNAQIEIDIRKLAKNCQGLGPDDLSSTNLPVLPDSLKNFMGQVKKSCDMGLGFAIVDHLNLDEMDVDTAIAVSWILGNAVGRQVAQKWDGSMLYQVTDYGFKYGYGIRGSYTNVELVFHTDNAFGKATPEYVSLVCLHPAKSGGVSRFCSLYTVHNRLLERYPQALARLYEPIFFDRQAEHDEDEPKVSFAPMFCWDGEKLSCRAHHGLIYKGYELIGHKMDEQTKDALAALKDVMSAKDIWMEQHFKRGQIQFLNNRVLAHYRSEFEDFDDPSKKRHLVRNWHRNSGEVGYDG